MPRRSSATVYPKGSTRRRQVHDLGEVDRGEQQHRVDVLVAAAKSEVEHGRRVIVAGAATRADHRAGAHDFAPMYSDRREKGVRRPQSRRVRDDDVLRARHGACERHLAGAGGPDGRTRHRLEVDAEVAGTVSVRGWRPRSHDRPVDRTRPDTCGNHIGARETREREDHNRTEGARAHGTRPDSLLPLLPQHENSPRSATNCATNTTRGVPGEVTGTVAGARSEVHTRFTMLRTNGSERTAPNECLRRVRDAAAMPRGVPPMS